LLVRTAKPTAIIPVVRKQITAADPNQALSSDQPLETIIARRLSGPRTTMFVVVVFGAAALLLCATGIFGVVAYTVAQRSKEIGIRMALGADGQNIRLLVFRHTFRLVLTGLACGLPLSLFADRLYRDLLFQVRSDDSAVLFGGFLLLFAVALAASYLPARRAARIDLITVLRVE
jgi:putative ABC transport system permease protein